MKSNLNIISKRVKLLRRPAGIVLVCSSLGSKSELLSLS